MIVYIIKKLKRTVFLHSHNTLGRNCCLYLIIYGVVLRIREECVVFYSSGSEYFVSSYSRVTKYQGYSKPRQNLLVHDLHGWGRFRRTTSSQIRSNNFFRLLSSLGWEGGILLVHKNEGKNTIRET